MKANLLVFLVGLLHVFEINGQKTKSEQILEAKILRLESRLTDLEAKIDLLSDNDGEMTSKHERASMENTIQSLESEVLDWKNQVNLLQVAVNKLAQLQCNSIGDKVDNVASAVGTLADKDEDIKMGSNDTLEAKDGLLTTALNATLQEIPVGRCNVLFPNEPNRFPEVHQKDRRWRTALHLAANSTVDEVCQLLERGADPNLKDKDGSTPLHWAVTSNRNVEVTRLLLEKGADHNLKNNFGNTPLHWAACCNSNVEVTHLLLDKGADLNLGNKNGWTPLHKAVSYNSNPNVTRVLLEKGADPNLKDENGSTPLHMNAASRNADRTLLLLEKGADPNLKDNGGNTPLSLASDDVIKYLLKQFGA